VQIAAVKNSKQETLPLLYLYIPSGITNEITSSLLLLLLLLLLPPNPNTLSDFRFQYHTCSVINSNWRNVVTIHSGDDIWRRWIQHIWLNLENNTQWR